jgi:hypothetical protein
MYQRRSDLYMLLTQDFSTTLMHTSGKGPSARFGHGVTLIGTKLLICGSDVMSPPGRRRLQTLGFLRWKLG